MNDTRVEVENGKYTFGVDAVTGNVYCLRGGTPWMHSFSAGAKAIASLIYELVETKKQLAVARAEAELFAAFKKRVVALVALRGEEKDDCVLQAMADEIEAMVP